MTRFVDLGITDVDEAESSCNLHVPGWGNVCTGAS